MNNVSFKIRRFVFLIFSFKIMGCISRNYAYQIVIFLPLLTVLGSCESPPRSYSFDTNVVRCPKNYFMVDNMSRCHPLLTCSDLENVKFLKLIGYGAVKWVFLGKWNEVFVAVSVLRTPLYSSDFDDGLKFLTSLIPNRFVVQLVGYCRRRSVIATEYHHLNNANSLKYILSERAPSFDLPMKLCLNFVELLTFLHESPMGARVNCDSDSIEKILSQIVVTNQLELVLCDVDALPEFIHNLTISCGRRILETRSSLIPPELTDPDDPDFLIGYSVKSDIWKIPDVCNYFFSLAKADAISFSLYDITKKCKNMTPFKRPSSRELGIMYRKRFELIRSRYFRVPS